MLESPGLRDIRGEWMELQQPYAEDLNSVKEYLFEPRHIEEKKTFIETVKAEGKTYDNPVLVMQRESSQCEPAIVIRKIDAAERCAIVKAKPVITTLIFDNLDQNASASDESAILP